mgnify:CR=1 FL=1
MANCTRFQDKNCVELTNKKTRRAPGGRPPAQRAVEFLVYKKEGPKPFFYLSAIFEKYLATNLTIS